jgi:hypothetical protein
MDRFDIQYNDSGLLVKDNDLVWDKSDTQHVEDTINAAPGWWKENFTDGVNIRSYLNSSGQEQVLARSIKIQLESDLYTVTNPKVAFDNNGKLIVQPNATI